MLALAIILMAVVVVLSTIFLLLFYWKFGLWKIPIRPVILKPDEMGIKVILGEPVEFLDSGLRWIPLFFECYVARFPQRMYNLDYPARKAITKKGKEDGEDGEEYGSQSVEVDSVAYASLPKCFAWIRYTDQGEEKIERINSATKLGERIKELEKKQIPIAAQGGLVEILRREVPLDEAGLKAFTEEAVVGALRVAVGKVTWRKATEDIDIVRMEAEEVFKSSDGALLTAGFHPDDLRLAIEEINLPKKLEDALPGPDQARLEANAAEFVSRTRAIETVGTIIQMMAESRGKKPEEIQDSVEADPDAQREFLDLSKDLIRRRMAIDGRSFVDIRVEGAGGIEQALLNFVAAWQRMPEGGKEPEGKKADREPPLPGTELLSGEARRELGMS